MCAIQEQTHTQMQMMMVHVSAFCPYSLCATVGRHHLHRVLILPKPATATRGRSSPVGMSLEQFVFGASTLTSALCVYTYETQPSGYLAVGPGDVEVKQSLVPGAGLGLFAARDLEKGDLLGSYPGRIWPSAMWLKWKGFLPQHLLLPLSSRLKEQEDIQTRAREYVWNLDAGFILDPTSIHISHMNDSCHAQNGRNIRRRSVDRQHPLFFRLLLRFGY